LKLISRLIMQYYGGFDASKRHPLSAALLSTARLLITLVVTVIALRRRRRRVRICVVALAAGRFDTSGQCYFWRKCEIIVRRLIGRGTSAIARYGRKRRRRRMKEERRRRRIDVQLQDIVGRDDEEERRRRREEKEDLMR
jgi:hypothetical protein